MVADLAKRRGYFWPSFEIYGGVSGFLDLGPLGTAMKRRIIEKWLDMFIRRHGFVEISTPVITPERSSQRVHDYDAYLPLLNQRLGFLKHENLVVGIHCLRNVNVCKHGVRV